jgi:hypothetical protein
VHFTAAERQRRRRKRLRRERSDELQKIATRRDAAESLKAYIPYPPGITYWELVPVQTPEGPRETWLPNMTWSARRSSTGSRSDAKVQGATTIPQFHRWGPGHHGDVARQQRPLAQSDRSAGAELHVPASGNLLAGALDLVDQLAGLDRRPHPMSEIYDYEEELLGWQRRRERQRRPFQVPNAIRVVQPPRAVDEVLRETGEGVERPPGVSRAVRAL